MKREGGLWEELTSFHALLRASERAWRGRKNQRGREALGFMWSREERCLALQQALREGSWRPGALRSFVIRDPKLRLICAAPFEDRVVHHALCEAISPRLSLAMSPHSHACRVGYGSHSALADATQLVRRSAYVLRLDVAHYFESIPHDPLCELFGRLFKEPPLLKLIELILRHPTPFGEPHRGLPIGSLTSQHAANLYLSPLDHHITRALPFKVRWVRYMDDLVVGVSSPAEAWRVRDEVEVWLNARGLKLKPSATQLSAQRAGVNFLGFRLWPHRTRLDQARKRRLIRRVKAITQAKLSGADEYTLRASAEGLSAWASMGHTRALRASLWARRYALLTEEERVIF